MAQAFVVSTSRKVREKWGTQFVLDVGRSKASE